MDIATIIGLVLSFGAIIGGYLIEGGKLHALFVVSAAIIVFGGSLGATIISFTLQNTLSVGSVLRAAFLQRATDRVAMLQQLVALARQARRSGILTLESEARQIDNEFLRNAIQLVVDGISPELVRDVLDIEIEAMRARHKVGIDFFMAWGGFLPTLGVLGTVMGLVHMLEALNEPGSMGPAIATAFIATFYGVGFANIVILPLAGKLKANSQEETQTYEMAIEGILALQAGENPRVVSMKMRSYLSPVARRQLDEE